MKKINISTPKYPNTFALVDDDDYEYLKKYKWHMTKKAVRHSGCKKQGTKPISMHRMILDPPKNKQIDHINHKFWDCQKNNMRICTHQENLFNQKAYSNKKYKGVSKRGKWNIWRSRIRINKKLINLGDFKDPKLAAKYYNCAARILYGEYAYLNKL